MREQPTAAKSIVTMDGGTVSAMMVWKGWVVVCLVGMGRNDWVFARCTHEWVCAVAFDAAMLGGLGHEQSSL